MKTNERIILTYIGKFKKVDFTFFANEFNISPMLVLEMVVKLICDEFVIVCDNELLLTEKGKQGAYESCNKIFIEEESIPTFDWTELYIPKNFEEVL